MDNFLRADNASSIFPNSPTNSFLADEVASICPLITPSPPTNDLINPLPEPAEPNYAIGEELANKLQHVQDDDKGVGDSASSSSSIAEPACTQLLNHRNTYHPYTKDEEAGAQETNGKTQNIQLTFRNPPDNYFFMSWNWPLIRKISLWTFLAGLAAMVALVISMVYTLPKTCNPPTEWYQGSVFYEIFPASYHDSNQNMIGDFKGISKRVDYLKGLKVRAIRLNSIFETPNYPEDYKNVTQLTTIAHQLGTIHDFKNLVKHFSENNISIILDLPVYPIVKQLTNKIENDASNNNNSEPSVEFLKIQPSDVIEDALRYWVLNGVQGFYLKNLERFTDDPNLGQTIRRWKKLLCPDRIFIVSNEVVEKTPNPAKNILLNNVDLVDIRLDLEHGVLEISKEIENIQNGTLYSQQSMPWIHWSLGDENTVRLANRLSNSNGTLGAILFQLMLPGTPSIFYGDEIGLLHTFDPKGHKNDIQHLHQLGAMEWKNRKQGALYWLYGDRTEAYHEQYEAVANMTKLRSVSPSIYVNAVNKEGDHKANSEVKYSQKDLLVLQRWYPRRKAYVVVCNFGQDLIEADLSTILYSGSVKVGPKANSKHESITFKQVTLWPGESIVIELD